MGRQFKQIIAEVGDFAMQQKEQTIREKMNLNLKEFADKVAAFNKLGEALYGGGNFSKLAEDLEEIATHAEAYTLRETEDSPFDQVTIKRNMKELKGYTSEFKKVAAEARALQERMTALYEDSGRVLGRYFEIKEYGSPDGMSQIPPRSENEKIVNANPGLREEKMCESCGKPMEQCECMNEGETKCPGCDKPMSQCDCPGHVHEEKKWIQKAVDPEHKGYCTPMTKPTCTPRRKALAKRFKKGIEKETVVKENKSMKLKHLMEEVSINDDYPKDDWVKLDVPKLRIDVAEEFEKDLKKKKFNVRRFDWKERVGHRQTFSEFFAKKDDFNQVNDYAVRTYPQFDENSKLEKE